MSKETLRKARKEYPYGTMFLTATENCAIPMKVVGLRLAEHLDRKEKIKKLQENGENPSELRFLLSLKEDIINYEGGLIYDSETDTWARKVC